MKKILLLPAVLILALFFSSCGSAEGLGDALNSGAAADNAATTNSYDSTGTTGSTGGTCGGTGNATYNNWCSNTTDACQGPTTYGCCPNGGSYSGTFHSMADCITAHGN